MIHSPNFKVVEFDHFRMQAGLPNFVMSINEWIEKTNAIGIIVKKGRYGYQRRNASGRTFGKAQPDSHSADAGVGGKQRKESVEIVNSIFQ